MEKPSNREIPQYFFTNSCHVYNNIPDEIRLSQHFINAINTLNQYHWRYKDYYFIFEIQPYRAVIKFMRKDLLGAADKIVGSNRVLVHFKEAFVSQNELR